ncbi:hypothetical protein PT300_14060 [Enterobacteriaceae bacterium ESL0689]|nr:hypothetical protein [Enterobacteriaceae bacterium ESL0689]
MTESVCSELVTDNEQDLTLCYPQKNRITSKKTDYWFHLQPFQPMKHPFLAKLSAIAYDKLWIKLLVPDLSSATETGQ